MRARRLRLAGGGVPVTIGRGEDNLGFAGGTNAWMRPLLAEPDWTAVWILNPDTYPEPDALAELVDYARKRGKGMVGSRLMIPGRTDIASSSGLKWNKLTPRLTGVDMFAPVTPAPDPEDVERRMDSPTGPSMYVTRGCIERIGLMDESFFLYWEEVDWAFAPKPPAASAMHIIPWFRISAAARRSLEESCEAIGLFCLSGQPEQLHFVRRHHPRWLHGRCSSSFLRSGRISCRRVARNFAAANNGLFAGLRGETGRPRDCSDPGVALKQITRSLSSASAAPW